MRRIKRTITALAVLSLFAGGGYYLTIQAQAGTVVELQPEGTTVVAPANRSDEELLALYPGLPLDVARSAQSVVATQQVADTAQHQGYVASGVILNKQQILTAGHNVAKKDGRIICDQMTVAAGAPGAARDLVTHASVRYNEDTDFAVLNVAAAAGFRSLPAIAMAKAAPARGETVYFINFQSGANGKQRTPANRAEHERDQDYSKPVIFSGAVLKAQADDILIAAGGGISYGHGQPDVMVRKGASGGAVVNARGELIGLSVSSASLQADHSAAAIFQKYGVRLPQQNYQIAHAQPIVDDLLHELQSSTIACDKP